MAPPKGRKITRRRPGTGPSIPYFTAQTQEAIVLFSHTENRQDQDRIYIEQILPAFSQLVENLINVYKFQVRHETKEDLRNECTSFLYTVITKFKPEKGSKAFSYFNVVARNWLTVKSKQSSKNSQVLISLSEGPDAFTNRDMEVIEGCEGQLSPEDLLTQDNRIDRVYSILADIKYDIQTQNEAICMQAIDTLFANVDELDFINKRAVLVYLRTLTGMSPKQQSMVLSVLKKRYREVKADYDRD